jgi:hypothetical protein
MRSFPNFSEVLRDNPKNCLHKSQPRHLNGRLDGMKGAYLGPPVKTPISRSGSRRWEPISRSAGMSSCWIERQQALEEGKARCGGCSPSESEGENFANLSARLRLRCCGKPEDAFRCFMGTEIEVLVVGNCFLAKEDQNQSLKSDYRRSFDLD